MGPGEEVGRDQSVGQVRATCVSGAGNRFLLLDRRAAGLPEDASARAAQACAEAGPFVPDGVLWGLAGGPGEDLCMVLHNADGSRPEACGNALRCLVYWAVEHGVLSGGQARVGTDGGPREVRWRRRAGALEVQVSLGAPLDLRALRVEQQEFQRVSLANPHAVQCLDGRAQLDDGRLERVGPRVQAAVLGGTNVEFVARTDTGIAMRVWERGVGPTQACGTGSAAAAWVASKRWGLEWPITVSQPGGMLTVDRDAAGDLWLAGPVRIHGEVAFPGDEWVTCSTS